jgi:hypothetical protein
LVADSPGPGTAKTDFNYWYFASLALFQFDGRRSDVEEVERADENALVPSQKTGRTAARTARGSAVPLGDPGSRVWATRSHPDAGDHYWYANVLNEKK